jgi:hypothetical protein
MKNFAGFSPARQALNRLNTLKELYYPINWRE